MPQQTAYRSGVKSTTDLIVSHGRTGIVIADELRPVFRDITRWYEELRSFDSTCHLIDPKDRVAIAEFAGPVIQFYRSYFDTFACLAQGYEYAGKFIRMSHTCIVYAFGEFLGAKNPHDLEAEIIEEWTKELTMPIS